MKIYRSHMEKILHEQEMDTIITNPKQPVRTFFRKVHYILSVWGDKLRRHSESKPSTFESSSSYNKRRK